MLLFVLKKIVPQVVNKKLNFTSILMYVYSNLQQEKKRLFHKKKMAPKSQCGHAT